MVETIKKDTAMLNKIQPQGAYYGSRTQQALQLFSVSDFTYDEYPLLLAALARVKKACAMTNREIGALEADKAEAVMRACDEVAQGKLRGSFPLCVFPGSPGLLNTAMNEVLARRANELLTGSKDSGPVFPDADVNLCQSANDVVASARVLAMYDALTVLLEAVPHLERPLQEKAEELCETVKLGRAGYKDSFPVTFGQVFTGLMGQVRRNGKRLEEERARWTSVPLGATAIGTGLGTRPGYAEAVCRNLSKVCGRTVQADPNPFDSLQSADSYVLLHAHVQAMALCCGRIAADVRIMSSGPRAGLKEITLVPLQPGSSIMPGKMNPTVAHMVMQISQRVSANHAGLALAAGTGEMDLGPSSTVLFKAVFDSIELVSKGMSILGSKVINGLGVNTEHCQKAAENSLALAAVAAMRLGEAAGLRVAQRAEKDGVSCREAAVREQLLTEKEAGELFDVLALTDSRKSAQLCSPAAEKR